MPMKKIVLIMLFFLTLIIIVAFTIFGQQGFMHMRKLQKEVEEFENHNAKLQKENEALRHEIKRLKDDLRYIEELARKELGLIKEDELLYHLEKNE